MSGHLLAHRQVAQTLAGRGEDRVGERGRERRQPRLADAAGVRAGRRFDDVDVTLFGKLPIVAMLKSVKLPCSTAPFLKVMPL